MKRQLVTLLGLMIIAVSCADNVFKPIHYQKPGGRLAYITSENQLIVSDPDGRNPRVLRENVNDYGEGVRWSPDGLLLVCDGGDSLFVIDRQGNVQFAFGTFFFSYMMDYRPTGLDWSCNSQSLIFTTFQDFAGSHVYLWRVGDAEPIDLVKTTEYAMFGDPAISPSEKYCAFFAHVHGTYYSLCLQPMDGSHGHCIKFGQSGFNERMNLCWLTDDRLCYTNKNEGLVVVDTLGTMLRTIPYRAADEYDPPFARLAQDRSRLLFECDNRLRLFNTSTWTEQTASWDTNNGYLRDMSPIPGYEIGVIAGQKNLSLIWFDGSDRQIINETGCSAVDWTPYE